MLPTDELIAKAFSANPSYTNTANGGAGLPSSASGFGDWSKLIPKIWAAQIETNLRNQACFLESVVENTDLLGQAGDTVYIPSLPDLDAVQPVLESANLPLYAMNNASYVPFVPSEYGLSIDITRKLLDRIKYDGISAIVDRMGYSMTKTLETGIANLGPSAAVVPGTSTGLTKIYPGSSTTTNVTAGQLFNDNMILNAVAQLRTLNNIPWPDGFFRLYISPYQFAQLMQDPNTRNDIRYAAPNQLLNGEAGVLHACRIVVTNWVSQTNEGAGGAVPVSNALLLAPRWAAIAWKRQPAITIDPTLYDMGRHRHFGITADFDIELLHAERALVIKSS